MRRLTFFPPGTLTICLLLPTVCGITACGDDSPSEVQNHTPQIIVVANHSGSVGEEIMIELRATDPDDDQVTLEVIPILSSSEFRSGVTVIHSYDASQNIFHFTPQVTDIPSRKFIVQAIDGRGGRSEAELSFEVNSIVMTLSATSDQVSLAAPIALRVEIKNHGEAPATWEYGSSSCMAAVVMRHNGSDWRAAPPIPPTCTADGPGTWFLRSGQTYVETVHWNGTGYELDPVTGFPINFDPVVLPPKSYDLKGDVGGHRGGNVTIRVVE